MFNPVSFFTRALAFARHSIKLFLDYTREHGIRSAVSQAGYILGVMYRQRQLTRSTAPRTSFLKLPRKRRQWKPSGNIRILFVSGEHTTPGHKYRIANLVRCLPDTKYDIEAIPYSSGCLDYLITTKQHVDLIWIWRFPLDKHLETVLRELKTRGTRIHYDTDDLMINPDLAKEKLIDGIRTMGLEEDSVKTFYRNQQKMLMFSDHASSPTHALCAQLLFFHPIAHTIPNTFTSEDLVKSRLARKAHTPDGCFRMGYASGSKTHQKDFAVILPALCGILEEYPQARLVVYPLTLLLEEYPELAPFESQIEKRELCSVEDLAFEYSRYDVNLCPLEVGNVFCECKSQLKFFEAALCETPTIASPTSPYAEYIEDGVNGFLAVTPEEWKVRIKKLIDSPQLRIDMGKRAKSSVLWNFSPDRLRLAVESVICHAITPELSRQTEAQSLDQLSKIKGYKSIALSETDTVVEHHAHEKSRVTVVMPLYNYAHFVEKALNSVLKQTLKDLDLVIVDDQSTDDSLAVARRWVEAHHERFGSVKLVQQKVNSNLAKTRNVGVSLAETEFYFPLDPDNYLEKDCLEKLLNMIEQEKCGFTYPILAAVGDAREMPRTLEWSSHRLRNGNYIDAMAMIRKSTWTCIGGYTHDPKIVGWEDFDFWCKCVEHSIFGVLTQQAVANYRAHPESMLSTITDEPGYVDQARATMKLRHPWLILPEPTGD